MGSGIPFFWMEQEAEKERVWLRARRPDRAERWARMAHVLHISDMIACLGYAVAGSREL